MARRSPRALDLPAAAARRLRHFGRATSGATAVEFAMVAVPLIGAVLFFLQMAMLFFFEQSLQTVAVQAARLLKTGSAQQQGLSQTQFAAAVCKLTPSVFACPNVMIDVQSSTSFSSVNTTTPTPTYDNNGNNTNVWRYDTGGPGSIVILRVMYSWPLVGGPLVAALVNQPNQSHLLVGTSVVKNEPYQ